LKHSTGTYLNFSMKLAKYLDSICLGWQTDISKNYRFLYTIIYQFIYLSLNSNLTIIHFSDLLKLHNDEVDLMPISTGYCTGGQQSGYLLFPSSFFNFFFFCTYYNACPAYCIIFNTCLTVIFVFLFICYRFR